MAGTFTPLPVVRRSGGDKHDWEITPTAEIKTGNLVKIGTTGPLGAVDSPSRGTGDRILPNELTNVGTAGRYLVPKASGVAYANVAIVSVEDVPWVVDLSGTPISGTTILGIACKPAAAGDSDVEVELNHPFAFIT